MRRTVDRPWLCWQRRVERRCSRWGGARRGRSGWGAPGALEAPWRPRRAAPGSAQLRQLRRTDIAAEDVDIGAAVGAAATAPWPPGAPLGLYRREKTTPHARNGPRPAVQRNAGRLPKRFEPLWTFSTHRHRAQENRKSSRRFFFLPPGKGVEKGRFLEPTDPVSDEFRLRR